MTSTITKRLFRTNLVATMFSLVFLVYLAISLPNTKTLWTNPEWATEQMQRAKSVEEMTNVFQMALGRIRSYERMTDWFFGVVFLVGFAFFCFLCVNLFAIGRLHRKVSRDEAG